MADPQEPPTPHGTTLGIPVRVEVDPGAPTRVTPPGAGGVEAPAPRRTAGRYEVLEEIGRGGMGLVFRAFDRDLRRSVAMKVMLERLSHDRGLAARFVDEAQATAQLQHPGIVPVYEIGLDDEGRLFFTMKLVRGRTLADIVERARRGDPEVAPVYSRFRLLQVVVEVARAVAFAHERGVIHRDLKPHNVMIGGHGEVQVMDWGLAKIVAEARAAAAASAGEARAAGEAVSLAASGAETRAGSVVGTPGYMAPEQARGDVATVGRAADVFSLGAVLFHVLTGGPPPGPAPGAREADPSVPRPLEAICRRALAEEPAERYPGAAALADDVQAWLEGRAVSAYRETVRERTARWLARRWAVALTLSAALLVLLAVAVTAAVRLEAARREGLAVLSRSIVEQGDRARAEGDLVRAKLLYARALATHDEPRTRGRLFEALATAPRVVAEMIGGKDFVPSGAAPDAVVARTVPGWGVALERADPRAERPVRLSTTFLEPAGPGRVVGVVSGTADICVVDVASGAEVRRIPSGLPAVDTREGESTTWRASASADGRRLAIADADGARVFDLERGVELAPARRGGEARGVRPIALGGSSLAIGWPDGAYVLDVDRPEEGWRPIRPGRVDAIAADAQGRRFALAAGRRIVILEGSREVRELDAGADVGELSLAGDWLLVTTSWFARAAQTRIFDAASGAPLATLPATGGGPWVRAMARRRDDGSDVVQVLTDDVLRAWRVGSSGAVRELRAGGEYLPSFAGMWARELLRASADGTLLLVQGPWDEPASIHEAASGAYRGRGPAPVRDADARLRLGASEGAVFELTPEGRPRVLDAGARTSALSPDGGTLYAGDGRGLRAIEVASGAVLRSATAPAERYELDRVSPDGGRLMLFANPQAEPVAGGTGGRWGPHEGSDDLIIVSTADLGRAGAWRCYGQAAAWSGDGADVAYVEAPPRDGDRARLERLFRGERPDRRAVVVRSAATGAERARFRAEDDATAVALGARWLAVACGGRDRRLEGAPPASIVQVVDLASGRERIRLEVPVPGVDELVFGGDDAWLAVHGNQDLTRIYDMRAIQEMLAVSPAALERRAEEESCVVLREGRLERLPFGGKRGAGE